MKLSKAQEKTLNDAKDLITKAREHDTYESYFTMYEAEYFSEKYNTPEKFKAQSPRSWRNMCKNWEDCKNGIVWVNANTKTLKKLESLGLIKIRIIGGRYSDQIKVLNF